MATTGQNYMFKGSGANDIFASNPSDLNYLTSIANYEYDGTAIGPYNTLNGSWHKQTDMPFYARTMIYPQLSISTLYGLVAKYVEYSGSIDTVITIPSGCSYLKIILIGAGGSGGAGGGDNEGNKGTNGAGGGSGGIWLGMITHNPYMTYSIKVGKGGASVSGGNAATGDSNNGYDGISGGQTVIMVGNLATSYFANGGGGGDGGHPSSQASPGLGATNNQTGADYSNAGHNSSGMSGGVSSYVYYSTYDPAKYPILWDYNSKLWGAGGVGTSGGYDPNTAPTGVGKDGYARIYFIF